MISRGNSHLEPGVGRGDKIGFPASSPAELPKKPPAGVRVFVGEELILRRPRGNVSVVAGGV